MAERLANRPVNINRSHDLMRELFSTPGSISPISHRELSMPYTAPEPPPPPEPNGTAVLLAGLVHEKHTNTADPE